MKTKLTLGKLMGIIFCIAAAIAMCILTGINIYLSGQMKTIDKYLKAVARDDFISYTQCFSESIAAGLTENDLAAAKSISDCLSDPEEFKAAAKFKGREKLGDGTYSVTFDLTVYNDNENVKLENISKILLRDGGKWVISPEY